MKRASLFLLVLLMFVSFQTYSNAYSSEISFSYDLMRYSEHVPDYQVPGGLSVLNSSASPAFVSIKAKLEQDIEKVLFGAKAEFPLYKSTVIETWKLNGADYQTNGLNYTLTNFDLFSGYRLSELIDGLIGLNISKGVQERENFRINGIRSSTGKSIETINSTNLYAELRGKNELEVFCLYYGARYLMPLSVSTTNTSLPSFNFSSLGNTFKLSLGGSKLISDNAQIKLDIIYKNIHYNGSACEESGGVRAKWPENTTEDIGIDLSYLYWY